MNGLPHNLEAEQHVLGSILSQNACFDRVSSFLTSDDFFEPVHRHLFKIIGESAVSSGVRRIEALTGEGALAWLNGRDARLRDVAASLKTSPEDVPLRVASLVESNRRLEK